MIVILFDIDETLLSEGRYPKNFIRIKKTIDILKRKEYLFGICTSRPLDKNVKKVARDYGINGPIIAENGACTYKKNHNIYEIISSDNDDNTNLNMNVKKTLVQYLKKNNFITIIKMTKNFQDSESILLNKNRIKSSTIRIPEKMHEYTAEIADYLRKNLNITKINVKNHNEGKINVSFEKYNKITEITRLFKKQQVYFITDYEEHIPISKNQIKLYSVGENYNFNKCCDKVFSKFGKGIEEILLEIKEREK